MLESLKEYAYAIFLGASLSAVGFGLNKWQFWIIYIGVIALVLWKVAA